MAANSQEHKACYGTMFPDLIKSGNHGKQRGKVFSVQEVGPHGIGTPHHQVITDLYEWDDCLACPEFEHCYRLCTARFAIKEAVEIR